MAKLGLGLELKNGLTTFIPTALNLQAYVSPSISYIGPFVNVYTKFTSGGG